MFKLNYHNLKEKYFMSGCEEFVTGKVRNCGLFILCGKDKLSGAVGTTLCVIIYVFYYVPTAGKLVNL